MISRRSAAWRVVCLVLMLVTLDLLAAGGQADEGLVTSGMKLGSPTIPENVTGAMRELNARMSKGIKPADNAVVHLVQLFGKGVLVENLREPSLEMLGIEALDPELPRLIYMRDFAKMKHPENEKSQDKFIEKLAVEFHDAAAKPWKSKDYPILAEYFDVNKAQLDRVTRIADLPAYYAPLLSEDQPPSLMSPSFAIEYRLPYLSQCLAIRAMSRLTEGDFADATRDLIAGHKLALLLANGSPMDVSMAKAHWVDSNAFRGELEMLRSGLLTEAEAREYAAILQALPPMPKSSVAADVGERFIVRQEIELLRDNDDAMHGFFDWDASLHLEDLSKLRAAKINWDLAIKRADEIQDETVNAMLLTDREKQMREIDRLNQEATFWKESAESDETKLNDALMKDPEAASKWIGESVARSLKTNIWQRVHTDNRGSVRRDFMIVALALVAYQKAENEFPNQLADLSPSILKTIPLDTHSNEMFGYQKLPNGKAQLTSWGADRIANAGQWPSDDLVIELE